MKLYFIRHGDPDYEKDSLTEKGFREAKLLAEYLYKTNFHIDHCYISPLGRAKDTARFTLDKLQVQSVEKEWLQEFPCRIWRPDRGDKKSICWDWLPENRTTDDRFSVNASTIKAKGMIKRGIIVLRFGAETYPDAS